MLRIDYLAKNGLECLFPLFFTVSDTVGIIWHDSINKQYSNGRATLQWIWSILCQFTRFLNTIRQFIWEGHWASYYTPMFYNEWLSNYGDSCWLILTQKCWLVGSWSWVSIGYLNTICYLQKGYFGVVYQYIDHIVFFTLDPWNLLNTKVVKTRTLMAPWN